MERYPSVSWPRFLSASHKQSKSIIFIKAMWCQPNSWRYRLTEISYWQTFQTWKWQLGILQHDNLCTFFHLLHTVPKIKLITLLLTGFMASASPKPRSRDQFRSSLHRRRHPRESLVKCPNTSLEFNGVLWEPNQSNIIPSTPYYQVAFKPGSKISLRSPSSSSPSPWQHLQPS